MAKILLLHHGVYGQTRKICQRLQAELASLGDEADVVPLVGGAADPSAYDAIIVGASIRNGKHNPAVFDFIRTRRSLLESKPSGFFSVNLVARKPIKNTPATNPYVKAFLGRIAWKPKLVGVFGENFTPNFWNDTPISSHSNGGMPSSPSVAGSIILVRK